MARSALTCREHVRRLSTCRPWLRPALAGGGFMKVLSVVVLASSLVLVSPAAFAQGGATSSITGVVTDAGGGVLPGATVVVASNATGTKNEAVTNATGNYT